ncbi:MAG: hypothetical protein IT538_13210, partial [Variibacter sp.]|nr:hypothetical protein [Variibacter sp.]
AREAEARLKEREVEAAQTARFSVVSGMASSLAHEMNQPMTAARALARSAEHILQRQPVDLERAGKNISGLIAQIDHASEIIRRTRHFLSRRSPHPTTLAPLALVEGAAALARADMEARHIALRLDVPADLPLIHGDQVQLQQVILNLARNGVDSIVDAFPVNGRITIAARRRDGDVVFSVADNGAGINPEIADRLFQPLNTSKSEGLGLGLSICHSIIEQHGGRIWVQSALRGATEFSFSLPIQSSPAPHP